MSYAPSGDKRLATPSRLIGLVHTVIQRKLVKQIDHLVRSHGEQAGYDDLGAYRTEGNGGANRRNELNGLVSSTRHRVLRVSAHFPTQLARASSSDSSFERDQQRWNLVKGRQYSKGCLPSLFRRRFQIRHHHRDHPGGASR